MGGIWNVIDEEAHTLASLFDSGKIKAKENTEILVAGPYFGHRGGADWNRGLNRITDMEGLAPLSSDGGELEKCLKTLESEGIKVFTGEEMAGETRIGYLQFQTSDYGKIRSSYMGKEMTLESRIKAEAYELLGGLDSLKYESLPNGAEYTHYLSLSHSISELIRLLIGSAPRTADTWQKKVLARTLFPVPGFPFTATSSGHFMRLQDLKNWGGSR